MRERLCVCVCPRRAEPSTHPQACAASQNTHKVSETGRHGRLRARSSGYIHEHGGTRRARLSRVNEIVKRDGLGFMS